jgi:hypothetical protein
MGLKFEGAQFVLAGDDPDCLQTFLSPLLCELANLASLLLAAPSPARTEFEEDRHASVICRADLSAEDVRQLKLQPARTVWIVARQSRAVCAEKSEANRSSEQ